MFHDGVGLLGETRGSINELGAHIVTVYLKVSSSYERSVRVICQLRFMIIESLVVLPISVVFLMLMAISSKLYSPAES